MFMINEVSFTFHLEDEKDIFCTKGITSIGLEPGPLGITDQTATLMLIHGLTYLMFFI